MNAQKTLPPAIDEPVGCVGCGAIAGCCDKYPNCPGNPSWKAPEPSPALPDLDEELRWILGRPNFACHGLAECLRRNGHTIAHKAEHEQAAAIHWMLGLYLKHGAATWRTEAERILEAWRAAQK